MSTNAIKILKFLLNHIRRCQAMAKGKPINLAFAVRSYGKLTQEIGENPIYTRDGIQIDLNLVAQALTAKGLPPLHALATLAIGTAVGSPIKVGKGYSTDGLGTKLTGKALQDHWRLDVNKVLKYDWSQVTF